MHDCNFHFLFYLSQFLCLLCKNSFLRTAITVAVGARGVRSPTSSVIVHRLRNFFSYVSFFHNLMSIFMSVIFSVEMKIMVRNYVSFVWRKCEQSVNRACKKKSFSCRLDRWCRAFSQLVRGYFHGFVRTSTRGQRGDNENFCQRKRTVAIYPTCKTKLVLEVIK